MAKLTIEILKTGLFSSIQDEGRYGHLASGIPISGAMDKSAMHMANELVGNTKHHPVIEFTLLGPSIRFDENAQIALAGADFEAQLNYRDIHFYETLRVEKGDVLHLGQARSGCRGYLAINGDWEAEKWLGSYSHSSIYMNSLGLKSCLETNEKLVIQTHPFKEEECIPRHKRPIFSNCTLIRTVTSPDFEQFDIELIDSFYDTVFKITNQSNRMGCRLEESIRGFAKMSDQISSGIIPGTIQVNNEGKPMILTADAQTTGGYPRIANVVDEDLDMIGQLRPGDQVKFQLVGLTSL